MSGHVESRADVDARRRDMEFLCGLPSDTYERVAAAILAAEERGARKLLELACKAQCLKCEMYGKPDSHVQGDGTIDFHHDGRYCEASPTRRAFRLAGWVAE